MASALVSLATAPLYPQTHRSRSHSEADREALRHLGPALVDPRGRFDPPVIEKTISLEL